MNCECFVGSQVGVEESSSFVVRVTTGSICADCRCCKTGFVEPLIGCETRGWITGDHRLNQLRSSSTEVGSLGQSVDAQAEVRTILGLEISTCLHRCDPGEGPSIRYAAEHV